MPTQRKHRRPNVLILTSLKISSPFREALMTVNKDDIKEYLKNCGDRINKQTGEKPVGVLLPIEAAMLILRNRYSKKCNQVSEVILNEHSEKKWAKLENDYDRFNLYAESCHSIVKSMIWLRLEKKIPKDHVIQYRNGGKIVAVPMIPKKSGIKPKGLTGALFLVM